MVEGLLQKQGLYSRAWKVRYCVLTESGLAYSAHQGANGGAGGANGGFVPISSSAECLIAERDGKVDWDAGQFHLRTHDREWRFRAPSAGLAEDWVQAIRRSIQAQHGVDRRKHAGTCEETTGKSVVTAIQSTIQRTLQSTSKLVTAAPTSGAAESGRARSLSSDVATAERRPSAEDLKKRLVIWIQIHNAKQLIAEKGLIQSLAARLFLTDNTMVHHVNHAVANKVRAKLMAKGIESDFQEAGGKIKITVRHLAKVLQVLGGRALEDKVSKALTKHGVIFTLQVLRESCPS